MDTAKRDPESESSFSYSQPHKGFSQYQDGWKISLTPASQVEQRNSELWVNRVQEELPVILHVASRIKADRKYSIHLFCADPKQGLSENADKLVSSLNRLAGKEAIWVPMSTNHSMMLHTMRMAADHLGSIDLDGVSMIFIGDTSNKKAFADFAGKAGMSFYFQACL